MLVIRDGTLADAVAAEQHAGDARVLCGDDIGAGQDFERAQRDIAEIADRRRDEVERRLERPGGDLQRPDAVAAVTGLVVQVIFRHTKLPCFRPSLL